MNADGLEDLITEIEEEVATLKAERDQAIHGERDRACERDALKEELTEIRAIVAAVLAYPMDHGIRNALESAISISTPVKPEEPDVLPGLERAERIIDGRLRTALALNYKEVFRAALEEVLVFIRAEIERERNPGHAETTLMDMAATPVKPPPLQPLDPLRISQADKVALGEILGRLEESEEAHWPCGLRAILKFLRF